MSFSAVFKSIWQVVDAVNDCPRLKIGYPTSHEEQNDIARGFEGRSDVNFNTCGGAIDGMLVWTERPFQSECKQINFGPADFLCGRKGKFGFNFQGVCDSRRRIIECWINMPGSASDFMSFLLSDFYQKIKEPGFLAAGLAIFGDNAYVSNSFMVTPYKSASGGLKDDFNFFHSQLRINIECAFGILVHRWAILRRPLPARMGLKKQIALVMCLVRLHNFCIDNYPGNSCSNAATGGAAGSAMSSNSDRDVAALPVSGVDEWAISNSGGVDPPSSHTDPIPAELLNGGEHFNDFGVMDHRNREVNSPRSKMKEMVERSGKHRPVRKQGN